MQKWLQDANIPSKIILDSAIGYADCIVYIVALDVNIHSRIVVLFCQ